MTKINIKIGDAEVVVTFAWGQFYAKYNGQKMPIKWLPQPDGLWEAYADAADAVQLITYKALKGGVQKHDTSISN